MGGTYLAGAAGRGRPGDIGEAGAQLVRLELLLQGRALPLLQRRAELAAAVLRRREPRL